MPVAARWIALIVLAAGSPRSLAMAAGRRSARQAGGRRAAGDVQQPSSASHWAYQPVKRAEPPAVKESGWVTNPIDRFILAGLEEMGWSATRPRPIASR